jgi:hypothetical protein
MENKLVPDHRPNGKQLLTLHLRKGPLRTHVPERVPQWFADYVKANDMWCNDAYKAIEQLYAAYNTEHNKLG